MYFTQVSDQINAAIADYFRKGFSIDTKARIPNKEVHGFKGDITDTDCAIAAIDLGLLDNDGIKLTDKGFRFLCHLKS